MEKRLDTSSPKRSRKDFLAAAFFTSVGILSLGYSKPGQKAATDFQVALKSAEEKKEDLPFKVEPDKRAVLRKTI